jgi:tetratricopeptide (TPR) repeat protein
MNFKNILLLFLFSISFKVGATISKTDSLLKVLSKLKDDTIKVNVLRDVSSEISNISLTKARGYAQQELALAEKLNWKKGIANAYLQKGFIELSDHKYELALDLYNSAIENFVNAGYKRGEGIGIERRGDVYMEMSDYKKAITEFEQALQLFKEINDRKKIAEVLGDLAKPHCYLSDYPKALNCLKQSLKIKRELKDKSGEAHCFIGLGIIYYNLSDYANSLDNYLKALHVYTEIGDQYGIASSLGNSGLVYEEIGDYTKALDCLLKELKMLESMKENGSISTCMLNIGSVYLHLNSYPKAIEYFSKALNTFENNGNKRNVIYALNGLGSVYQRQNNYPKALAFLMKALVITKEIDDKNGYASTVLSIGQCYLGTNNFSKAEANLNEAYNLAKQMGVTNTQRDAQQALSECYEKQGKQALAFSAFKTYINLRDSIINADKQNEIARRQMQFDFDKKEATQKAEQGRKDAVARAESLKQRQIKNLFIVGFIMMLLLAGVIYRNVRQKNVINAELEHKNILVETQHKNITDSITYAKRIQQAMLPSIELIKEIIPQSFVLYKPKDVVSGDFYAFEQKGNNVILAAVDCTGHGVPGAFMSLIGHNLLTEVIVERKISKSSQILEQLNKEVRKALKQDKNDTRDGMDLVLCNIDFTKGILEYAGANRPLWILKENGSFLEIKGTKASIGGHTTVGQPFENHVIEIQKGDSIFLMSDGFVDQFGGPEEKKFMTKKLKETLIGIKHLSMDEQHNKLDNIFENWKGKLEQLDDVLVIGIKV